MSSIATLIIDGSRELTVLSCDWQFSQMVDSVGKPVSIPKGGLIRMTLEADDSDFLFHWMTHPTMPQSGTVTFYKPDGITMLKTVRFVDSICVGYLETFDYLGLNPQQIHLTISAREFTMGNTTHVNNWPQVYETSCSAKNEG